MGSTFSPARRTWLRLALLFLLVQTGALVHGYQHDQHGGDESVCELCLAYAGIGAALTGTAPVWCPPAALSAFAAPLPAASPRGFRPIYQSRAPPPTC